MYNLMCSLIVLMQHLQLNHSCVFIVVSKVGNRVTIQLASYAKKSNTKIVDNFKIFSKQLKLKLQIQYEIVINQGYYTRFYVF